MTDLTREFLQKCQEAGYKTVAIFVRDKRVPQTLKHEAGSWFGWGTPKEPYKVVCGHPERLGMCPPYPGDKWPLMWGIVKGFLNHTGAGSGDAHDVNKVFIKELTPGFFEVDEALK